MIRLVCFETKSNANETVDAVGEDAPKRYTALRHASIVPHLRYCAGRLFSGQDVLTPSLVH